MLTGTVKALRINPPAFASLYLLTCVWRHEHVRIDTTAASNQLAVSPARLLQPVHSMTLKIAAVKCRLHLQYRCLIFRGRNNRITDYTMNNTSRRMFTIFLANKKIELIARL